MFLKFGSRLNLNVLVLDDRHSFVFDLLKVDLAQEARVMRVSRCELSFCCGCE